MRNLTILNRNVTEIHYNYPTPISVKSVAFESDIHGTGLTMFIHDIDEFETELEADKQPNFDGEKETQYE